ncbi:MAG: polysaccharide biosynthesis C-terminal domain-containing protein [Phototrophicaceae bacterium]
MVLVQPSIMVERIHSVNLPALIRKNLKNINLQRLSQSQFIHNVAQTLATRGLLIIISLITSMLITRALGPVGRGIYATATAFSATGVQLGYLGLNAANTYYVAKDKSLLPILLGNSLFVGVGIGGLEILLGISLFFSVPNLSPLQPSILLLALIAIPVLLTVELLQYLLLGIESIGTYNVIQIAMRLVNTIGIFVLIGIGNTSATSFFIIFVLARLIGVLWSLRKLSNLIGNKLQFSFLQLQEQFSYGIRAYFAALFSFLVIRSDLFMVKYILGAEQVGYYSLSTTMVDMVYLVPVVVGTMLFPRLSASNDAKNKRHLTFQISGLIALLMLAIIVVTYFIAPLAITIVYGADFLPAVPAFRILLLGIFFMSINTIFMNYFAATGMPAITVYSPGIAAIINIIANIYLTPRYGIEGTAIASVIAYAIMLIISIGYFIGDSE